MTKYEEEMKKQYEILDQYDFIPYLKTCDDLDNLMFNFEYECDTTLLPPEYENCPFNFMTREDFLEYLMQRYKDYTFNEVISYKIRRRPK